MNKETLEKLLKSIKATMHPDDAKEALLFLRKAISDEDLEGMSIVDDPDQEFEDEADKWLAENDPDRKPKGKTAAAEPKAEEKKSIYSKDWEVPENLPEEAQKKVQEFIDQGYSPREAHRFAGAHDEPSDFRAAMRSGVNPSIMSEKHMGDLKALAKEWLENADRHEKFHADASKNPLKYAAGQLTQAHEQHTGDYKKAYHDFINSDKVKNLSGRDRHKAVREWKESWKTDNPDYMTGLTDVAEKQKTFGEARQAAKQSLDDKMSHIMGGGLGPGEAYSTEAGMQHAGLSTKQDEGPAGGVIKDPSASFAASNPKLVQALTQEQQERLNRVKSAKGIQTPGAVKIRKKEQ